MAYVSALRCRLSNRTVNEVAPSQVRVLLVEDNLTSKVVAQRMLERLGCLVDAVEDGELAMVRLSQHSYDLVVIDQNLPKASGFDVIDELRSGNLGPMTQDVEVVLLSGDEPNAEQKIWLELRRVGHRTKPVTLAELDVIVNRCGRAEPTPTET
jgi:two-component system sensor histidine kinase RpfC